VYQLLNNIISRLSVTLALCMCHAGLQSAIQADRMTERLGRNPQPFCVYIVASYLNYNSAQRQSLSYDAIRKSATECANSVSSALRRHGRPLVPMTSSLLRHHAGRMRTNLFIVGGRASIQTSARRKYIVDDARATLPYNCVAQISIDVSKSISAPDPSPSLPAPPSQQL